MKLYEDLAAGYWLDNTNFIYENKIHISTPIMEAYKAGYKEAISQLRSERAKEYSDYHDRLYLTEIEANGWVDWLNREIE